METLILTMLPFVLTFTVAAWHSPSEEVQPRSALPGSTSDPCCRDCNS
jgi:hypothetical protein